MTCRSSAAEMNPLPSLSKTLNASLISSSESVSFIFLAIIAGRPEVSSGDGGEWVDRTEELWEIDLTVPVRVYFGNHVLEFRLGRVLPQRTHYRSEFLGSDGPIAICSRRERERLRKRENGVEITLVKERERFLELGNLFLSLAHSVSHNAEGVARTALPMNPPF